jgi:NAD(P)-dependent dehydrogenase (short-subunit alcohol dehydrogenase family)
MEKRKLEGKTALITGASRGLGRAMALALAHAGAKLILVSRDLERLKETAEMANKAGADTRTFKTDVTSESDIIKLDRDINTAGSSNIQILINNAGINLRKPITEFTLDEWRRVIDTNLTSVFLMCRAFIPQMKGKGYGRILNLTSTMSHVSIAGRSAYSASKTGLLGLTRALALELAPEKITVNGISPGPFATQMNVPLMQDAKMNAEFVSKIPLARWGKVEEVGQLAVYLCSEEAGFITGTDILIDGGWTAQ